MVHWPTEEPRTWSCAWSKLVMVLSTQLVTWKCEYIIIIITTVTILVSYSTLNAHLLLKCHFGFMLTRLCNGGIHSVPHLVTDLCIDFVIYIFTFELRVSGFGCRVHVRRRSMCSNTTAISTYILQFCNYFCTDYTLLILSRFNPGVYFSHQTWSRLSVLTNKVLCNYLKYVRELESECVPYSIVLYDLSDMCSIATAILNNLSHNLYLLFLPNVYRMNTKADLGNYARAVYLSCKKSSMLLAKNCYL